MNYKSYIGIDVSATAIKICKAKFSHDKSKKFYISSKLPENLIINSKENIDMSISLDVIYHLVENEVFENYMLNLFNSSSKFVCIYSSNFDAEQQIHERRRKFTDYIEKNFCEWKLYKKVKNKYPYNTYKPNTTSSCDFYFYKKTHI